MSISFPPERDADHFYRKWEKTHLKLKFQTSGCAPIEFEREWVYNAFIFIGGLDYMVFLKLKIDYMVFHSIYPQNT